MAFRPELPAPDTGFQGEGLLVVVNADRGVDAFFAADPAVSVPTIRARVDRKRVVVSANGPVAHVRADSLERALVDIADGWATALVSRPLLRLTAGWCSWYTYWNTVTAQDVIDNLAVIDKQDLGIEVVQVDDGYQKDIGDWLDGRPGFGDLDEVARRIIGSGRTAGLWTAPFLVGVESDARARAPGLAGRGSRGR